VILKYSGLNADDKNNIEDRISGMKQHSLNIIVLPDNVGQEILKRKGIGG
jgi:cytochrome c